MLSDEIREDLDLGNEVYYKIIKRGEQLGVACLQWFDEYDYDQDNFLADEDDIQYRFNSEEEAKKWLNNNIKPEYVYEEDKILNNKFNRKKYFIDYEEDDLDD